MTQAQTGMFWWCEGGQGGAQLTAKLAEHSCNLHHHLLPQRRKMNKCCGSTPSLRPSPAQL